jgi:hypothetical protein
MSTPRLLLPYPAPEDPADVPADVQGLAEAVDPVVAAFAQGAAAARPAPGIPGRFYFATDTHVLTYDDGAAWRNLAAPPVWGGVQGDGNAWFPGSGDWTSAHVSTGRLGVTFNTPMAVFPAITIAPAIGTTMVWGLPTAGPSGFEVVFYDVFASQYSDCTFIFTASDYQ